MISSAPAGPMDTREWERGPLVVTADLVARDQVYVSLSQNISGGGMFLSLAEVPPLGTKIQLKFTLRAGGRDLRIVADARVVWTSPRRPPSSSARALPCGVGVQFVNLSASDRAHILAYVKGILGRPCPP